MEVNSRKHQAFIKSKKNCPPSIRHQLLKIFPVAWEAPVENATGAGVDQNSKQYITFRSFKKQLDVIPGKDQYQYEGNNGNSTVGTYSQDDCDYRIKLGKFQWWKIFSQNPAIRGSCNIQ